MATPGPIVLETVTLLTYVPFAADGFARTIWSMKAPRFSRSCLLGEGDLPDGRVHVSGLVDAELDLARLDLLHGAADVEGDGAGLGRRHQAPRTEDATERSDLAHEVRGGDA